MSSPKLRQQSIREFGDSSLDKLRSQGYKIVSSGWIDTGKSDLLASKSKQSKNKGGRSRTKRPSSTKPLNDINNYIQRSLTTKTASINDKNSWERLQAVSHDENKDLSPKSKKQKLLLTRSDSFEKYGVVLPSVDQILKTKASLKKEARILDEFEALNDEADLTIPHSFEPLVNADMSPLKASDTILDCKSLSHKELKQHFKENFDLLQDVIKGLVRCERHEVYKNQMLRSKLMYNTSTVVFSEDQKEYLLTLLDKKLDLKNENTEYLLMVLLPELCLKIFMSVYDMSNQEAVDYLNWRPID